MRSQSMSYSSTDPSTQWTDCGRVSSAIFLTQRNRCGFVDNGADTSRDRVGALIGRTDAMLRAPAKIPVLQKAREMDAFYRVAPDEARARAGPRISRRTS